MSITFLYNFLFGNIKKLFYSESVTFFFSFCVSGEVPCKNLYKIPLSNLVGRSIERPLKSPLAPKVITTTTSSGIASLPVTHSLSLSRMEIKEIASRTRKELLGKLFSFLSVHINCQVCNV